MTSALMLMFPYFSNANMKWAVERQGNCLSLVVGKGNTKKLCFLFPLAHQLMLIYHTRPKNVRYVSEGRECMKLALSQLFDIHMCTLTPKYWRINYSQASGGGRCAQSAAVIYSKLLGLTTTRGQNCFLFFQRAECTDTKAPEVNSLVPPTYYLIFIYMNCLCMYQECSSPTTQWAIHVSTNMQTERERKTCRLRYWNTNCLTCNYDLLPL